MASATPSTPVRDGRTSRTEGRGVEGRHPLCCVAASGRRGDRSPAGMPIKAIAKTYQVHRVTVSAWIKHWEHHGAQSLHDKPRRDPAAFAKAKRELEALQKQEDQGQIALYYFDESGFALDPTIPSAWQEPKNVIELPARKYGRINVLGLMNRQNDLHPFIFEDSIHTGVVIACFDAFCHTLTKKTVVVIDNASIHTSEDFEDRIPRSEERRVGK